MKHHRLTLAIFVSAAAYVAAVPMLPFQAPENPGNTQPHGSFAPQESKSDLQPSVHYQQPGQQFWYSSQPTGLGGGSAALTPGSYSSAPEFTGFNQVIAPTTQSGVASNPQLWYQVADPTGTYTSYRSRKSTKPSHPYQTRSRTRRERAEKLAMGNSE